MSVPVSGPGAFAERLRGAREAATLTQEELAERAGVTAKAIGALERGERRRPYPHTVRALADALGLDDDARTALAAAARPGARMPADRPNLVPSGVPAAAVRLLGRDGDRRRVLGLFGEGARLVTLTGPGGVGKTSLALDVARRLAPGFGGAVAVVELAAVREPALVLPAVAGALGLRQFADPLDRLTAVLAGRRTLLVLDNVEHVLDAVPDVAELLARCPALVVLATSRAALRVRAEQEVPLAPLAVPAESDVSGVAGSPAAQVFLDRARAAGREVALTSATAPDVAAICRRLDGLPLALELAAAHARFLSPAALLARLDEAVSSPRSRDLPPRQRTIRATLDWSHALLTADEQVLLRRLAVFVGGFPLEAAEAVGAEVDVLAGLVEQSLVVAEGDRYRMLEPVRQYAAGRLADSGEAVAVADGAADFFADLAAGARTGLKGPDQTEWLDLLGAEHGNLTATWARLLAGGRPGRAARLGEDTWLYWALRGNAAEGLGWLDRVRAAAGGLTPVERAALGLATSGLRYATGDVARMAEPAADAEAAATDAGDDGRRTEALVLQGSAAAICGDPAAEGLLAAARQLARATGNRWALAHAAAADGQRLLRAGDLAGSVAVLTEAEGVARALGSPFTLATVLNALATLAGVTGDEEGEFDRLTEATGLGARIGTPWTLAYALPRLATLAVRRGQAELAVELFGAAAWAETVTATFPPVADATEHQLAAAREQLGDAVFRRAWERGRGRRPGDVPELASLLTGRRGSG